MAMQTLAILSCNDQKCNYIPKYPILIIIILKLTPNPNSLPPTALTVALVTETASLHNLYSILWRELIRYPFPPEMVVDLRVPIK